MTICEQSSLGSKSINPLVLLIPILLLIAGTAILFSLEHAVERHGNDAVDVCNADPLQTLVNPLTNRSADVCQLPDGRYGVKICGSDGCTITAFVKEKMKDLDAVLRYLTNRGYQ